MAATGTITHSPTKRNRSRWAALLTLAALTVAACSSGDGTAAVEDEPDPEVVSDGRQLSTPSANLASLDLDFATLDGGIHNTADYVGTPMVINFFASWCPSCIAEMPDFEEVFNEVKGEIAFLGLAQDQSASDALNLVAETGITYSVGWDPDLEIYSGFGAISMPATVFVGANGEVVEVWNGVLNADALRDKIDELRA